MQRIILSLIIIALIAYSGFFFFKSLKDKVRQDFSRPVPYPTITKTEAPTHLSTLKTAETQSLFVPYWTLKEQASAPVYDQYIYFGIVPTKSGIDLKEQGSLNLEHFSAFVPDHKKKLLAVRMIDPDTNFAILNDAGKQKELIDQAIMLARDNKFDGIVLDLEVSAIPFDSLIKQINQFTENFYTTIKQQKLTFEVAVYGDVFYRVRPFDIKTLAKNSDQLLVMAYDFSKAKGDPGPNFPLKGAENYGYDYTKMTEDFLRVVPPEKIVVVFGLFGYDWVVDNQGKTLEAGQAITLQEAKSKFIDACKERSCAYSRDGKSIEMEVKYEDHNGIKHIIWFEDQDSVAAKKTYLKQSGINNFSYWAYSYF
ncbi:MAG TPA: glycosyl hydrolase family 18 protein [Patescibacteria group bacterium]